MPAMQSEPELVAAVLAVMVVFIAVLRRRRRRAPGTRYPAAARVFHRVLGYLQVGLICVVLLAVLQLAKDAGIVPGLVKPARENGQSRLALWSPNGAPEIDSPVGDESLVAGRVVKVKDGDSLLLRISGGKTIEARLYGIDAPEYLQSHGKRAKRALGWKVSLRQVEFRVMDTDSYGRRIIRLYRKGRDINAEMVCEGHAWWYRRYARRAPRLEACERTARAERLGLWREDAPVPPWRWRRSRS